MQISFEYIFDFFKLIPYRLFFYFFSDFEHFLWKHECGQFYQYFCIFKTVMVQIKFEYQNFLVGNQRVYFLTIFNIFFGNINAVTFSCLFYISVWKILAFRNFPNQQFEYWDLLAIFRPKLLTHCCGHQYWLLTIASHRGNHLYFTVIHNLYMLSRFCPFLLSVFRFNISPIVVLLRDAL